MLIDRIRAKTVEIFHPPGTPPPGLGVVLKTLCKDDGSIQVYCIDNVAQHCRTMDDATRDAEMVAVVDAGTVSPLARSCWFEFAVSEVIRLGALAVVTCDTQRPDQPLVKPGSFAASAILGGARWVVAMLHFAETQKGVFTSFAQTDYAILPNGRLAERLEFGLPELARAFGASTPEAVPPRDRASFNDMVQDARLGLSVSLMATAIANIPGTRVETTRPADFIQRSRARRKLPPLTTYRVLDIGPIIPQMQAVGTASVGAPSGVREHMVRAHFNRYSDERPLFGRKGNPALIWVPAHKRGDAERGVVKKDYRVLAPAGSFAAPTADGPEGR